jgi:hypothetical protein
MSAVSDVLHGDHLILTGIVISAVLAIVVPVLIYRRQRRVISIDYDIVADIRLIESDAADSFGGRIKVTHNSHPVRHPRIVDVKVMNTGNTPVKAADYERPIVFQLEGGHPPRDATLIGESTPNITGTLFESKPDPPRAISIQPALLNKGEWFTLRMLFDDKDSQVIGTHHIAGGEPMRRRDLAARSPAGRFVLTTMSLWGFSFVPIVIIAALREKTLPEVIGFTVAGMGVGAIIMTFANAFFMPRDGSP